MALATEDSLQQRMTVVFIGHVDHGKSSVVGRLLADTGNLPEDKIQQIQEHCQRTSRPFEYAFLLDGLKDEQAQGITIEVARCFFRSNKRPYCLIDAPGHIEFLKNMISGATRAEAAVLVVDAKEGVKENTKRHCYLLSMLGIRQTAVVINKMDLVGYSQQIFNTITATLSQFLDKLGARPQSFIPASARLGDNIAARSTEMPWYKGPALLEQLDTFENEPPAIDKPLRMPVQDVYKFTDNGDQRRIIAGRIESGRLCPGERIVLFPSGKISTVATIEAFPRWPYPQAIAGQSIGLILEDQIYVQPGQLICKAGQQEPICSCHMKVRLFWMGATSMLQERRYKLKIGTATVPAWLKKIFFTMDASDLVYSASAQQIDRFQVAECILETLRPIAFDPFDSVAATGRFVIVDNYQIAGGGVVLEGRTDLPDRTQQQVQYRQRHWQRTELSPQDRQMHYHQRSTVVIVCGQADARNDLLAKALEKRLFEQGRLVYYLGLSNSILALESDPGQDLDRDQILMRLGEICHLFADAGLIIITSVTGLDAYELKMLTTLTSPYDCLVVHVGQGIPEGVEPNLVITDTSDLPDAVKRISSLLSNKGYLLEYYL